MSAQPMDSELLAAALALRAAGVCTFPASATAKHPDRGIQFLADDGMKPRWKPEFYPPTGWPTEAQQREGFAQPDVRRMFVVAGERSGNLAGFDFDDPTVFEEWWAMIPEAIRPHCYVEKSQRSGGRHVAVRVNGPVPPSTVPARDAAREVRIELRGEGGGFMASPSEGYERVQGSLTQLPVISQGDFDALMHAAALFNQWTEPETPPRPRTPRIVRDDELPGDRYNRENGQGEVVALLEQHGWRAVGRSGDSVQVLRPGTTNSAHSGSVNHDGTLVVFSENAAPFDAHRQDASGNWTHGVYDPFGVYARLEHGGSTSAAAKALSEERHPRRIRKPRVNPDTGEVLPPDVPSSSEDERDNLPEIDAGDLDLPRVAAAAWEALQGKNEPPYLFRYGGLPARLKQDDTNRPALQIVNEAGLRHILARSADWYEVRKTGSQPALPPLHVVRDMLAEPDKPLPVLIGIAEAPTFASDGTLHSTPGYHITARMLYAPAPGFNVPDVPAKPTAEDIARARSLILDDLIEGFPFTGDAERAHAVALYLLPFVRSLIDGPTPLHLIEKPTAGTGASLMVDALAFAAIGASPGVMTEGRDEDEWRKRITARLRGGDRILLIDNLRRQLDSASLAAAITARVWKDRLLGTSDELAIPIQCGWVATANNAALSSEMTRRTVRIRLDAKMDRPWMGREFRHPNLLAWCGEHRGELAWAALVLGQAWLAGGRPIPDNTPVLGMFESWSRVMGSIFAVAGIPGFLSNLSEFYDTSDTEGADIRAFLATWWGTHGAHAVTVADLFTIATAPDSALDVSAKTERGERVRLGRLLTSLRDRHYQLDSGLTVRVVAAGTVKHAALWRLEAKRGESHAGDSPSHFPSGDGRKRQFAAAGGESSESSPVGPHVREDQEYYHDISLRNLGSRDSRDSPAGGDNLTFSASGSGIESGESQTRDSPSKADENAGETDGWEVEIEL